MFRVINPKAKVNAETSTSDSHLHGSNQIHSKTNDDKEKNKRMIIYPIFYSECSNNFEKDTLKSRRINNGNQSNINQVNGWVRSIVSG